MLPIVNYNNNDSTSNFGKIKKYGKYYFLNNEFHEWYGLNEHFGDIKHVLLLNTHIIITTNEGLNYLIYNKEK